jgi:hypothetical protein
MQIFYTPSNKFFTNDKWGNIAPVEPQKDMRYLLKNQTFQNLVVYRYQMQNGTRGRVKGIIKEYKIIIDLIDKRLSEMN